jgi:hypothetical protein
MRRLWRSCLGTSERCRHFFMTPWISIIPNIALFRLIACSPRWPRSQPSPISTRLGSRLSIRETTSTTRPTFCICASQFRASLSLSTQSWRVHWIASLRGSWAECLDGDRTTGGIFGRQSFRIHRRRYGLPLGPSTGRCESCRLLDA